MRASLLKAIFLNSKSVAYSTSLGHILMDFSVRFHCCSNENLSSIISIITPLISQGKVCLVNQLFTSSSRSGSKVAFPLKKSSWQLFPTALNGIFFSHCFTPEIFRS
nr:MAG TPA: Protein of unknown function (DUF2492) [Caudoviricetes sp.]